jgi:hypothetical protein
MWSGEEAIELRFYKQVLYAAILYPFITYLPYYQEWVPGLVDGTMAKLTAAVIGGGAGATNSVPDSFGHIATKCFSIGLALAKAVPNADTYGDEVMLGLAVIVYVLLAVLIIAVTFALFLIAFVLTHYLLAYGPVFITMLYFEQTSQFFDGWFRAIVAGMLVQLFLVGDLAMMTVTMNGYMALISPVMNPTGTTAATGEVGFMLWDTFGVLIVLSLFVLLAGISVYLAVQISGGAHHQLVRRPRGGNRTPTPSQPPSGGPSPGSPGGSVQSAGSPPRTYDFQSPTPMGPAP